MFFMRKRLCNQADPLMRYVANLIKKAVLETNPEFEGLLVPLCEYRNGMCTEMFPCEKAKIIKNTNKLYKIMKLMDIDYQDIGGLPAAEKTECLRKIVSILYDDEEKESV